MGAVKHIEQEITQYLPHLNTKQKQAVLSVVKTFASEQKDWWDELAEEQQQALDNSIAQMNLGKLTSHSAVMKKYAKWQKK